MKSFPLWGAALVFATLAASFPGGLELCRAHPTGPPPEVTEDASRTPETDDAFEGRIADEELGTRPWFAHYREGARPPPYASVYLLRRRGSHFVGLPEVIGADFLGDYEYREHPHALQDYTVLPPHQRMPDLALVRLLHSIYHKRHRM